MPEFYVRDYACLVVRLGEIAHRTAERIPIEAPSERLRFIFAITSIGHMLMVMRELSWVSTIKRLSGVENALMKVSGEIGAYTACFDWR